MTQKYLTVLDRVCKQGNRSPFGFDLLTTSPGEEVDPKFKVTRGVGGIITVNADVDLYGQLEGEIDQRIKKVLHDRVASGRRIVEFYPHG
jgi:hypothetical protein